MENNKELAKRILAEEFNVSEDEFKYFNITLNISRQEISVEGKVSTSEYFNQILPTVILGGMEFLKHPNDMEAIVSYKLLLHQMVEDVVNAEFTKG